LLGKAIAPSAATEQRQLRHIGIPRQGVSQPGS
jgi:hypothetical protein